MAVYYPSWLLNLSIPVAGSSSQKKSEETQSSVVNFNAPVRRFRLERNDHTKADSLEVTCDWSVLGADPRMITDGTGTFSLWNAVDGSTEGPKTSDVRFCGIMQRARRQGAEDGGMSVDLLFHDYTSLFLAEKPFVSSGRPDYSQTLSQAWARICDHVGPTDEDGNITSVVSVLRNRLVFEGDAKDVVLGKAVSGRFKGQPIGRDLTDAWAVWQQCVGMLGLISFIRLDQCVVTTATDYYSTDGLIPRLIWGRNIHAFTEERDIRRSQQGIVLTSFDPMTATVLEAFWPPIGSTNLRKKHLSAKKAKSADATLQAENRIVFAFPGVTDVGVLQDIAKMVYEVRSKQEFAGHLETPHMTVAQTDGGQYDLTRLGAGEVVRVEIDQDYLWEVLQVASDEKRVQRLVELGYNEGIATVLVRNLSQYSALSPKFFTKTVIVEGETTPEGGSFKVEIEFCNRINVDGSAT